jgi:hypothetical protein
MEYTLENIRNFWLRKGVLCLNKSDDVLGIFKDVDSFVELSQGNTTVKKVYIDPYDEDAGNYELWEKLGLGVGNFKSLKTLYICLNNEEGDDNEHDVSNPDWEILARILRHIRHAISLDFYSGNIRGTEEMRTFATAIQGHPAITRFVTIGDGFHEHTRGPALPLRNNRHLVFCLDCTSKPGTCFIVSSSTGQRGNTGIGTPQEHDRIAMGAFFAIR